MSAADTPAAAFRYILRYQIDPGWEPEARLDELVGRCWGSGEWVPYAPAPQAHKSYA